MSGNIDHFKELENLYRKWGNVEELWTLERQKTLEKMGADLNMLWSKMTLEEQVHINRWRTNGRP
jgi:hypothetical protein